MPYETCDIIFFTGCPPLPTGTCQTANAPARDAMPTILLPAHDAPATAANGTASTATHAMPAVLLHADDAPTAATASSAATAKFHAPAAAMHLHTKLVLDLMWKTTFYLGIFSDVSTRPVLPDGPSNGASTASVWPASAHANVVHLHHKFLKGI